ncbi:winged helix-turn-helix transcriptional regulator [Alicyclobacillus acidocaldarius]|uniref:Transcriptional regulator, HxlR family n=1 Tax=Alicyclobacillus acidocaldarius subsp. acidocaldarius (strain ATCC 27009 / DSM 446 / BCRC 14685 / JCM 5260 / KCTC 1825 / NBRC 15652 / NCIMB 11725 / NRRL B-14509 / 104-IA) TaxID=521098 RepID=C8WUD9_ALIAD|nr:helix-turn-helix domain-containing protein [Alicyclobacillus acidocaldarius]ACV57902.1 transcriptional regulator, HxlR family [Alicyclobacillus acidocaldarius subsp. acidocaldarius DSM 446]
MSSGHRGDSPCSAVSTLQVLSGKWKWLILYHLFQHPSLRFSELMRRIPGITQRVLTKQLRELEEEGIVERTVYPEVPPRVEYAITPYGQSLRPILDLMHAWGLEHLRRKAERALQEPKL